LILPVLRGELQNKVAKFSCFVNIDCVQTRQKSSGAEGERLKEAANINRSLSTLG